jgi:hypothetical protein
MRRVSWLAAFAAMSAGIGCTGDDPHAAAKPQPPVGFRFEAIGGQSFASFGWAGTQHDIDVPDGTPFSVMVDSCQGSDGPCRFHGPVQVAGDLQRQRCLNRMSKVCTSDADCADDNPGPCVFIYDPPTTTPLPTAGPPAAGLGACAWSYIPLVDPFGQPAIVGSIDQTSGEVTLERFLVYLALNGLGGSTPGGCEVCVSQPGKTEKANDGVKDGMCTTNPGLMAPNVTEHSLEDGQPCDINRDSKLAGFNAAGYSMDCSPSYNHLSTPSPIGGALSTADFAIKAADGPKCTFKDATSASCFCGVCTGLGGPKDGTVGCHTSGDCQPGEHCGLPLTCTQDANGMCTTGGSFEVGTRNNDCSGACTWSDVTGLGTCTTAGGAQIRCYPDDAIRIKGSHVRQDNGTFVIDTASATCNGATQSAPLNRQVGLPGLTFQKRSFRVIPLFQESH